MASNIYCEKCQIRTRYSCLGSRAHHTNDPSHLCPCHNCKFYTKVLRLDLRSFFILFVLNCVFFPFVEVLHVHVQYSSYIYCIFFLIKKTDVSKRKVHTTKMIFVTKNAILYIVVLTIIFVYIIRNCSLFKSFSANIKNNYFHMRQGFKWKLIF